MSIYTILMLVAAVILAVLAVVSLVLAIESDEALLVMECFAAILMCGVAGFDAYRNETTIRTKATALEKAESGKYKVFVDGNEVAWDSIDFDSYNIKINTEKKRIYCTKK